MESSEVRLARIEEIVVHIRGDVKAIRAAISPIAETIYEHKTEIALMKRDKKWEGRISHGLSALVGSVLVALVEWFKH